MLQKQFPELDLKAINKKYKVAPPIHVTNDDSIKSHYDFDQNIVYVNPNRIENYKDFVLSYLHELHHALKTVELGGPKGMREAYEMDIARYQATHPGREDEWYAHHPYEKEAEEFAHREVNEWL